MDMNVTASDHVVGWEADEGGDEEERKTPLQNGN